MVDTGAAEMGKNIAADVPRARPMEHADPPVLARRTKLIGIATGLGSAAIWGGMCVVSKQVLDVIPPLTLVFLRVAIGTVTLAVIALATRAPVVVRRDLPSIDYLPATRG